MNDIFGSLIARARGTAVAAKPSVQSRFASADSTAAGWGEVIEEQRGTPSAPQSATSPSSRADVEMAPPAMESPRTPLRVAMETARTAVEPDSVPRPAAVVRETTHIEKVSQRVSEVTRLIERIVEAPTRESRPEARSSLPVSESREERSIRPVPAAKLAAPPLTPNVEALRSELRQPAPASIHVKIGRIEIKAPQAPAVRAVVPRPGPASPKVSVSLRDYLSSQGRR